LLRELELIRRWQPRCNVQGQPRRRRRWYVCIGRKPAPQVFLTSRPAAGVLGCFGPVLASYKASQAVRHLNDLFRLRDCPRSQVMVFADQREFFPAPRAAGCIRHEIGTCLGPCAALCSERAYAEKVRAAAAFLAGRDVRPLERVAAEMESAAARTLFERAAALRDKLDVLRWLQEGLWRVRQARARHSFVYPVRGHDGETIWHLIHRGQVRASIPAPRTDDEMRQATLLIRSVFRKGAGRSGPWPGEEIDGVFLVAGWFRRHPQERGRTIHPRQFLTGCSRLPL